MKNPNVNLFLDLDETLVHTLYADNEKHADQLLDMYSEYWAAEKFHIRHDGWYVSFKRNITPKLLEFCREVFGVDNVYILSHGATDYVLWVNKYLNLGFDPNTNIYGRDDIERSFSANPKFTKTFNILVDNESYLWHTRRSDSKIEYLDEIPASQFVQVPAFTVYGDEIGFDDDVLEKIKEDIIKATKQDDN